MRHNKDVIKNLKDEETKKIYPQTHSDSSLDEEQIKYLCNKKTSAYALVLKDQETKKIYPQTHSDSSLDEEQIKYLCNKKIKRSPSSKSASSSDNEYKRVLQIIADHNSKQQCILFPQEKLPPQEKIKQNTTQIEDEDLTNDDIFAIEDEEATDDDIFAIITDYEQNLILKKIKSQQTNQFKILKVISQYSLLEPSQLSLCNRLLSRYFNTLYKQAFKLLVLGHNTYTSKCFYALTIGKSCDPNFEENDCVNIIGQIDESLAYCCNDDHGGNPFENMKNSYIFEDTALIILEPSVILTPTLLSYSCSRIPIFDIIFGGKLTKSEDMVIGSLIHDVFQFSLNKQQFSFKEIYNNCVCQINNHLEALYLLNLSESYMLKKVEPYLKKIYQWLQSFINQQQSQQLDQYDRKIKIKELVQTEQFIESKELGLRGYVDCSFLCEIVENSEVWHCQLPFELKTGNKIQGSHYHQVMIYTLLTMQNQTNIKKNLEGLLYYIAMEKTYSVCPTKMQIQHLIAKRNTLAKQIKKIQDSPIDIVLEELQNTNPNTCNNSCWNVSICAITELSQKFQEIKDIEDLNTIVSPQYSKFHKEVTELWKSNKKRFQYFNQWISLIQGEENSERMTHHDSNIAPLMIIPQFNEFLYNLQSSDPFEIAFEATLAEEFHAYNFIDSMQFNTTIQLILQSKLIVEQIVIKGIIKNKEVKRNGTTWLVRLVILTCPLKEIIGRTDSLKQWNQDLRPLQDRFSLTWLPQKFSQMNHFSMMRQFVFKFVSSSMEQPQIIIDFSKSPNFLPLSLHQTLVFNNYKSFLNIDQQDAIIKFLQAQHFSLIWGFPGTGKTHLIAVLLLILRDLKQKVLITSYTHSALDNIMFKLIEIQPFVRIVRFGKNRHSIHPELQKFMYINQTFRSVSEIKEYFQNQFLHFSTALWCNQQILDIQEYDVCVMDEASQSLEPLTLGPIQLAKKFLLIGDHNQLQPLVKSSSPEMQVSLFERLLSQFPQCVTKLRIQFRMNEDIMSICNRLIYEGNLISHQSISQRVLVVHQVFDDQILADIFQPERKVVFVDFSQVQNKEFDIQFTLYLLEQLVSHGVETQEVACITPFNKDKYYIQQNSQVEAFTIDKSQGLDKNCSVILLRQNLENNFLMQNKRRFNVAFSRSKMKLIIIGHLNQLEGVSPLFQKFVQLLQEQKQQIYNLENEYINKLTADQLKMVECD